MEDKYLEKENYDLELKAEDLENVAGGRKWGDTGKSVSGPVTRNSFIKVADLGTDHKEEDPDEVSARIAAVTEHHSRSGGII